MALVSLEDKSGFDFIAKQLNISIAKSNIYKTIITADMNTFQPLFNELSREIPIDLLEV